MVVGEEVVVGVASHPLQIMPHPLLLPLHHHRHHQGNHQVGVGKVLLAGLRLLPVVRHTTNSLRLDGPILPGPLQL